MKLYFLRFFSLVLTFAVLTAVAPACAGPEEKAPETTMTPAAETTDNSGGDSLEARQLIEDSLPELDYGGSMFYTLSCDENIYDTAIYEEETGSALHDTVYKRDRAVEETLNIIFKHNQVNYADHETIITNSVLAGDDEYQLYLGQAIKACNLALNNYFLNWYDIGYIDFEKPWYNQNTNDALTIGGKCYLLLGSMSISSLGYTYCMFYNKDSATSYNIPDIYKSVNNGEWTYDKLWEYASSVYTDLNGNGITDKGDYFGLATRPGDLPTYMWSFDQKIVTVADDGSIGITFNSAKTSDIIDKLKRLYKENPGTSNTSDSLEYTGGFLFNGSMMFIKDEALFATGFIKDAISPGFLDYESDYGIIPYPKYDEAQKNYYTISDGSFGIMLAPVTVSDADMTGAVTEFCCSLAWKNVEPEYYDIALKYRGARDEESVAMLDLIVNSRTIDFAYLYDNWTGYAFSLTTLVENNTDFASYIASRENAAQKHYEKVVGFYFSAE
ncbi:MAG: hypothetical protein PHZ09_05505 [Eubacteriales bacterium]|jgi:hypothetical protein|nr:hypothetical protein [Eubacteriales bacterium]